MCRKNYLIAFIAILLSMPSIAQENAIISFTETKHNFGTIKEEGGDVEHEFVFTNKGNVPLVITSVNASCGCTTPGWTTDSIMPGKSGFVKAKYEPFNRPGSFNKTLTVNTNAEPAVTVLTIEGYVTPKPRTVEMDLPAKVGRLRFKYKTFNFGGITTKEPIMKEFEVYNESDSVITFSDKYTAPEHIKLTFEPVALKPKERGKVWVRYDAAAKKDFGFVSDNVVFYTNEPGEPEKNFSVYATIEEYFPPLSEAEKERAPRLTFNGILHDFGTVKKGDVLTVEFPFANTGGSELNIRKTKANCGCTVSNPGKNNLQPGESSSLTVKFNTAGREGTQQKTVTVFSNDPLNPTQVLTIKAVVK